MPVHFNIIAGKEYDAYYLLGNSGKRIDSLVFDTVRSNVPKVMLDDLFGNKDELAIAVQNVLRENMQPFGYEINQVMITSVEPDAGVKAAMNEIDAANKMGEAELAKAHNEQLVQVARAKGRQEAAKYNLEAEILDARAVAQSVEIIGKSLHENEGYLKYKWIQAMHDNENISTIYVPTEAGLPILEAGRTARLGEKTKD